MKAYTLGEVLDGADWLASLLSRFNPEEYFPVHTEQDVGWAPETVLKQCRRQKQFITNGNRTKIPRSYSQ
jgi:hypothetical protein